MNIPITKTKRLLSALLLAAFLLLNLGYEALFLDIKSAQAIGGVSMTYLGQNQPLIMNATGTPLAVLRFDAYDTLGGNLNYLNVTVKTEPGNPFDPALDLLDLNNGIDSGMMIWRDNGDGEFEPAEDIHYPCNAASWSPDGSYKWRASFSGMNIPLEVTQSAPTRLFLSFSAERIIESGTSSAFMVAIEPYMMTFSAPSTIGSWPMTVQQTPYPVIIDDAGSSGQWSPVLISEVQVANEEFVELYNRSSSAVDLNGWSVMAKDYTATELETGLTGIYAFSASTVIQPGKYYLLGTSGLSTTSDQVVSPGMLNNSGGFVLLENNIGTVVDKVGYGPLSNEFLAEGGMHAPLPPVNGSIERKAYSTSYYSTMIIGGVDHDKGNGQDSNNNSHDFIYRSSPEPQTRFSPAEFGQSEAGGGSQVLINEVYYKTDSNNRWIELMNRSTSSPADISGWRIKHKGGSQYDFAGGATIPANSYILVHWNQVGTPNPANFYTGNIGMDLDTYGGDLILLDSDKTTVIDYVQYGGPSYANEAAAVAVGQWTANTYVPHCSWGESLGRRTSTGEDRDIPDDWQPFASPTELAPNMGGDITPPDPITQVVLVDEDDSGYGLNGADIKVSWTADPDTDPTFHRYEIFLLPATTQIDFSTHKPVGQYYGQYQYYGGATTSSLVWYGTIDIIKDSANNILADGNYKAYIIAFDYSNNKTEQAAVSSAAPLAGEDYAGSADYTPPQIMHMGVWRNYAGQNLHLIAQARDDRAMHPATPLQIIWKKGDTNAYPSMSSGITTTTCAYLQADYYDCQVPWNGSWNTSSIIGYYLVAMDYASTTNYRYLSASPEADWSGNLSTVRANPFYVSIQTPPSDGDSSSDLRGYVFRSDGNPLSGATVFLEGLALPATSTRADGYFEFPDNFIEAGSYMVRAVKTGYFDMSKSAFKDATESFYLYEGNSAYTSGESSRPYVKWTAPGNNMAGAPRNIYCGNDCSTIGGGETPILIAFDRPMKSSTIVDANAADAASNIYLTTTGYDRVAGKVSYDSVSREARFYSSAVDTLSLGTYYTIVVLPAVTDEAGNPLSGGSADGTYTSGFTTIVNQVSDFTDYGSGSVMPPYVMKLTPAPGTFNVARNTSLTVEFSEAMDAPSLNSDTVKLYPVTNSTTWTLGSPVAAAITLDQATRRILTFDPASDLSASYQWWVLKISGQARSATGVWFANPNSVGGCADYNVCSELANVYPYQASFQVNTGTTDTTAPAIVGSYPKNNDGISTSSTAVSVGLGSLQVAFSEAMDPATINANTVKLLAGSSLQGGSVEYDSTTRSAKFFPATSLLSLTQYALRVGRDARDLAGNRLNATTTINFKTAQADGTSPYLLYANANDYRLAVTFSEPMNSAKQTDAVNWPYSVLNPANYFLNGYTPGACASPSSWACTDLTLENPYSTPNGTVMSGLGLGFAYDDNSNTVLIEGLAFGGTPYYQLFVDNVRDRSNNPIADSAFRATDPSHQNAARGPVYQSASTSNTLAPGAIDYNLDMSVARASVFPVSSLAGQTSNYMVDIPVSSAIPLGGKIVLTFPYGFDVSQAAKDPYSFVNNDINREGAGTITIQSVVGNQALRTVTITTGGAATQANDFLHLDLKGIINAAIPRDYGTEGYVVDLKTFTADSGLIQTVYTLPFYISPAGDQAISGNIHGVAAGVSGNMYVYLGSPKTGPMQAFVAVNGTGNGDPDGAYSFTNLPNGDYYIFTRPTVTLGGADYFGSNRPDPLWLSGSGGTRDITLIPEADGGAQVTVTLTGDFRTNGAADNIDIYASSPSGFRVKTLYNVGDVSGGTTTRIYLSTGEWMVGVGPSMSYGPMSGPALMPDWMPPQPVRYLSNGATPGNINISIAGQNVYTVSGHVRDAGGAGIAEAEVYAYQTMGSYGGAHAKTLADGSFVLKIPVTGAYQVGAFKPGLPSPKEQSISVSANVSGLLFTVNKPPYTISGKMYDSAGNGIAYAPVWAWQENGYGHSDTKTDAAGNYVLYVNSGNWRVEGDAPGLGHLAYPLAVTVADASVANINLTPTGGVTYYTISGRAGLDTNDTPATIESGFANIPVRAVLYDANGVYQGREYNTQTDSSGNYTFTVPAGIYRVDIWTKDYGEIGVYNDAYANNPANVNAVAGNAEDANIVVGQNSLRAVTVNFTNGQAGQSGYLNIEGMDFSGAYPKPNGFRLSRKITNLATSTLVRLVDGDYFFFLDVPGLGHFIPDASDRHGTKDDIVVTEDRGVAFTLVNLASGATTVSGRAYGTTAQAGNELANAWVWIANPRTGYHNGVQTAANGAYSLVVPSADDYMLGADMPGYMSIDPTELDLAASSSATNRNLVLTPNAYTISGRLYSDANSNSQYDSGEAVAYGYVRAETVGCLDNDAATLCLRAHAPADGGGYFELGAANGTWKVYGRADGYHETWIGANITVSGASQANRNVKMNRDNNWTETMKVKPITPAAGGSLDDTAAGGTGVKLTIPPNALGSSNATGNVNARRTRSVTRTNSSDPVGGSGVNISATDNSGQSINNLNDYIDIELVMYKNEVEAAIASGTTYDKLRGTKNGYWDATTNDWINLATTRNAFYKLAGDTEWSMYTETGTSSTNFVAFLYRLEAGTLPAVLGAAPADYKLVYSSQTNHFTVFAVIMPFFSLPIAQVDPAPDPTPPPSGGGGGGGGPTVTYCASVSYGPWGACQAGSQTREVTDKSPSGCRLTTAQEAAKTQACTLALADEESVDEPAVTSQEAEQSAPATTDINALYLEQGAMILRAEVGELMAAIRLAERNHLGERLSRGTLENRLKIRLGDYELRHQYALTNFITYGSPDTQIGWGERAGVLNSFMAAFGKVPATAEDWSDVIKIAQGRWPTQRSEQAEKTAYGHFRKVYLREPNRQNKNDDAAVTVITYGLRPAKRNLGSEAAAMRIFKAIYKYAPSGATDWDIVRAIAYSGAKR